jgi:hypothetical protein
MPLVRSPKWHDPDSKDSWSTVVPITEIITIEDNKLHDTFLHVAFRSQRMLRITSDQTGSNTN